MFNKKYKAAVEILENLIWCKDMLYKQYLDLSMSKTADEMSRTFYASQAHDYLGEKIALTEALSSIKKLKNQKKVR